MTIVVGDKCRFLRQAQGRLFDCAGLTPDPLRMTISKAKVELFVVGVG
jgi:hypothetical protein